MSRHNGRAYAVRADAKGPITFLLATENLARDNMILELDGLDTKNYERNPIVTWAHDFRGERLPIGRTTRLTRTKQGLEATFEFDSEHDPFAAAVEGKIRRNVINACSISWDSKTMKGNRITSSEMLEAAIVPIPGDPNCLAIARSAYRSISYRSTPTKSEEDAIARLHAAVCGTTLEQQLRSTSQRLAAIEQRTSPENIKRMALEEIERQQRQKGFYR